ncbi:hypothetical protein [Aedoeadaptatus coli]|uniref:hypothetical protein n=1 Tax=Aedoeadaptatus coli TaxID=2058292 RepID=UPI00131F1FD9|nr:hypothetical protein [Peptoniphilus coli]
MATKSFLKSVAIRKQKQKRDIARAMAQTEAYAKSTPYKEAPARILRRNEIKKVFAKEE